MILLVHRNEVVTAVIDCQNDDSISTSLKKPMDTLFYLANNYQERILVWCHDDLKEFINFEEIKTSFHLKNMMMSYSKRQYLPVQIGYVEDTPFLKVNKSVKYPTWLMNSDVGAIYSTQLLKFKNQVNLNESFSFILNSIAKLGMPNGLFCYSEPNLITKKIINETETPASTFQLFKFVKQHYKNVWSVLLLINFIINDCRFPFFSFIRTILIQKLKFLSSFNLEPLEKLDFKDVTIDVIIPTLGRRDFLHDVLLDLKKQILLPKQVIIIEQNEDENSKTELNFISNKTWPFKITHKFIHQIGACNARNLALKKVTSDYVYLADDDNKFDSNLLKDIIHEMQYYNFKVITMSYLQKDEVEKHNKPIQWGTFGGGSSVISSEFLNTVLFNMAYELGYGEDTDFGMQLRNLGADIIYTPDIKILHLKAPIGGFRTKFAHAWEKDVLLPKPSPTVMLNRKENSTKQQLLGYRTTLFFQFYKQQKTKNPFKYFSIFKKQWRVSETWANRLNNTI